MALESELVTAEGVEAMEFPDLVRRFSVSGVPHTTINAGAGTMVWRRPGELPGGRNREGPAKIKLFKEQLWKQR